MTNALLAVSVSIPNVYLFPIGIVIVVGALALGLIAFTGGQGSGLHEELAPEGRTRRPDRG